MADSIFGITEKAMQLTEDRGAMISKNLINSSTPNYKARDIDFHKALSDANQNYSLLKTSPMHIEPNNQVSGQQIQYRIPMQTSLDGNTVDDEIERKNFIENALRYQVSLTFIQNKSDELMKSIKGE